MKSKSQWRHGFKGLGGFFTGSNVFAKIWIRKLRLWRYKASARAWHVICLLPLLCFPKLDQRLLLPKRMDSHSQCQDLILCSSNLAFSSSCKTFSLLLPSCNFPSDSPSLVTALTAWKISHRRTTIGKLVKDLNSWNTSNKWTSVELKVRPLAKRSILCSDFEHNYS